MKYLIGFIGSILTMLFLALLNNISNLSISEFMFGWLSCMGYGIAQKIYEEIKKGE